MASQSDFLYRFALLLHKLKFRLILMMNQFICRCGNGSNIHGYEFECHSLQYFSPNSDMNSNIFGYANTKWLIESEFLFVYLLNSTQTTYSKI
jgi:hypothetical protein